jgi:hypothetical protein
VTSAKNEWLGIDACLDDHATSRQDPERLQAAAFILLEGDVNRIPHVKMIFMRDWCDGLVWAGLDQPDWPDRLKELLD